MKRHKHSLLRRFLRSERGQTGAVVIVSIAMVMGMAGLTVESGHIYYAYQQLQQSTREAALAAASGMPNITQANTSLVQYSSQSGQLNASNLLQNVSINGNYYCSTTVSGTFNVACQTPPTGEGSCTSPATTCNALQVTQSATIPLWFGGMVGMTKLNVQAQATVAMRGGNNTPWNIAIILDTTASMASSDGGGQCSGTKIACALQGVQSLLSDLYPCAVGDNCTTSTNYVDSVSLFVFPAVTTATKTKDYVCNTSNPTSVAYTFTNLTTNTALPTGDTYQVLGFSNNYKTSDTASALNQAAPIVIGAGDSGVSGCSGIQAPGGQGTYYAQVIYAAQSALLTQQTANPGSQNAIILLTDGDATACASNGNTSAGACNSKGELVAVTGTLNGTGTKTTNPNGYVSYAYPSALGECGQAVLAAQAAANAGTDVYTIGYNSPTSGGCASDGTYSASVTTGGGTWLHGNQPCQALAAMASAKVNFYSDDASGCVATAPSNQNLTKLTSIFRAITNNLSTPRLIPNGSA